MNEIVSFDLSRWQYKYGVIAAVLIITLFSCVGDRGYATELNSLPQNRTEFDSIKSTKIDFIHNKLYVSVIMDYIYPITAISHFKMMHLDLFGDGFSVQMNATLTNNFNASKHMDLMFPNPLYNNFTAKLFRSKHKLNEKEIYSSEVPDTGNTTMFCSSKGNARTRECQASKICIGNNTIMAFSRYKFKFDNQFIKFGDSCSLSGKMAQKQDKSLQARHLSVGEFKKGESLVVGFDYYNVLSYKWLKNVAAPLSELVNEKNYSNVYAVGAPHAIFNSSLLSYIHDVESLASQNVCLDQADIKQLVPTNTSLRTLRKMIWSKVNGKGKKTVVLTSNVSSVQFTNIADVAQKVTKEEPLVVNVDFASEEEIISSVIDAEYVFASMGNYVSLALWMKKGTFIEFIPSDAECHQSEIEAAISSGIKYMRYIVSPDKTEEGVIPTICSGSEKQPEGSYTIDSSSVHL